MAPEDLKMKLATTGALGPPKRLADELYDSFREMLEREFSPGDRLPSEASLADRFKVSRPTVRESLARLRDDGLIESRRGSGSFLTERHSPATSPLTPAFREIDSFDQFRQCYEFRMAVEGEAAFLAASKASKTQIEEIATAMNLLETAVESRSPGADLDLNLHLTIARASGNSWFLDGLQAMHGQIEVTIDIARRLSLGKSEAHLRAVQNEHVAIYEAIFRRDPDAAREAMRQHLTNTSNRILMGPT